MLPVIVLFRMDRVTWAVAIWATMEELPDTRLPEQPNGQQDIEPTDRPTNWREAA